MPNGESSFVVEFDSGTRYSIVKTLIGILRKPFGKQDRMFSTIVYDH